MDGYRYLVSNRFEFDPTRIESTHIIYPANGEAEELKAVDYIFTIRELQGLLNASGFVPGKVFSTPRKKPFVLGDGKAYLVAARSSS